jgi:hypothetical protein
MPTPISFLSPAGTVREILGRMKTSLGIWAFGPMATRFVPGGYKPELAAETTVERVRRAVEGLGDLIDGYEFHYPQELNEENLDAVRDAVFDRLTARQVAQLGEISRAVVVGLASTCTRFVDQHVDRHRAVGALQEHPEECALQRSCQRALPLVGQRSDRAENPEFHHPRSE